MYIYVQVSSYCFYHQHFYYMLVICLHWKQHHEHSMQSGCNFWNAEKHRLPECCFHSTVWVFFKIILPTMFRLTKGWKLRQLQHFISVHKLNFNMKLMPICLASVKRKKIKSYIGNTHKVFCVLQAARSEQKCYWPTATSKLDLKWTKLYVRFMKWSINELQFSPLWQCIVLTGRRKWEILYKFQTSNNGMFTTPKLLGHNDRYPAFL